MVADRRAVDGIGQAEHGFSLHLSACSAGFLSEIFFQPDNLEAFCKEFQIMQRKTARHYRGF
jgi:hypothetical protein